MEYFHKPHAQPTHSTPKIKKKTHDRQSIIVHLNYRRIRPVLNTILPWNDTVRFRNGTDKRRRLCVAAAPYDFGKVKLVRLIRLRMLV